MDYIVVHATDPVRLVSSVVFILVFVVAWARKKKKEGVCTMRAVGTVVSAEDEKRSFWGGFLNDEELPSRHVTIRFIAHGREVSVTDKVSTPGHASRLKIGGNVGYSNKCVGDKVTVFYNPRAPKQFFVREYAAPMSPLTFAFVIIVGAAAILFVPFSG